MFVEFVCHNSREVVPEPVLIMKLIVFCSWPMYYSYLMMTGFSHTGPISLFVDLCVFICVYFVHFCFVLHMCCIIVSTVGWTWSDWILIFRTYLPSVLWHCWLGHLTRKNLSPVWPIMCLVGRYTLLNLNLITWYLHYSNMLLSLVWAPWLSYDSISDHFGPVHFCILAQLAGQKLSVSVCPGVKV